VQKFLFLTVAAATAAGCFIGSSSSPPPDAAGHDAAIEADPPDADAAITCSATPAEAGDLPCDVSAVLEAKCQSCHTSPPQNGAPFPLRSYEDLVAPYSDGVLRWQRVAQVIEPNGVPKMPPAVQPQLTPAELDTLHAWFAACGPPVAEGTGCDVGEGD
jgi:mono/diheme cytochrome c family protein